MTTSECISLGAFAISCISALISLKGLRNSSRALRLTERDHDEKARSIEVYLLKALKMQSEKEEAFASFGLSYTNLASIPNSISSIELIAHYLDEVGQIRQTHFMPWERLVIPNKKETANVLAVPLNIPPRSTVNGWISFKLSPQIAKKQVKKYEIRGTTSDSEPVVATSYLLIDAFYGENRRQDRKPN